MDLMQFVGGLGLGGLIGTIGTQWATSIRETRARRVAFKKQQLEQFYGPLLSMQREIRARSELRVKLEGALDSAHMGEMLRAGKGGVESSSDAHLPAIQVNIDDINETFRKVLMPRYREMVSTFREKMWLAEPETRDHFFAQLVEFVDVWDKILDNKLPRSIAVTIKHTEANLTPFYEHLANVHDRLRADIK